MRRCGAPAEEAKKENALTHSLAVYILTAGLVGSVALAQGAVTGTTTVPAAGNTITLSQPTNGSGGSTTFTSLVISDATGNRKVEHVDYVVAGTGVPGSSPQIVWIKRPAAGTNLTIAGATAAQGLFTTTATWP